MERAATTSWRCCRRVGSVQTSRPSDSDGGSRDVRTPMAYLRFFSACELSKARICSARSVWSAPCVYFWPQKQRSLLQTASHVTCTLSNLDLTVLLHLGSKRRYMSPTHTQSHERSHKKSCCKSKRRVSLAAALSAHTRSRSASTRSNSVRLLLSHCQQQHRPSLTTLLSSIPFWKSCPPSRS